MFSRFGEYNNIKFAGVKYVVMNKICVLNTLIIKPFVFQLLLFYMIENDG